MKLILLAGLLALTPAVAFAACMEVDNSFEAGMPSDGCPPGYAPLNDKTLGQAQQDTNALNALAAQGQQHQQPSEQQREADQAQANEMVATYQQLRPKCDFVEQHPVKARLKAIAEGKPESSVAVAVKACHQLEAIMAQLPQAEQEEGITPANAGNN